ncbi:imidazole glycerol phosphate synthase subunit HisH [Bacillus kexueae]|uniref:imidazole glycerol phosphate synthase subunit HisH n=1 Tax=Aeribacillus kexueae TaxID=2078952 RepID=UPI001FAFD87C
MIGIIDYGMGNLFSVSKALERLQVSYFVSGNREELKRASAYILPGVGSFNDAMQLLNEQELSSFLQEGVENGKSLLGICLGMQLLFEESVENGLSKGLGLIGGKIERIPNSTLKVPHMGWNQLSYHSPHPLLKDVEEGYVYFVHSYYAKPTDSTVVLASAQYGVQVPAVVGKGNVFGTQFHPEKSSKLGMAILRNFVSLVEGGH